MFNRATLTLAAFAVLATGGAFAAASATDAEKQFLTTAMTTDNSEIAIGGLALARGSKVAVRDFGLMLINDHRRDKATVEGIATPLGVPTPLDIAPEAKDELTKLMGLSGAAFDQEFASFMVAGHTKAIAMYKDETKNKDDIGAYATKTVPVLEKHLKMAQSLASSSTSSSAASAPASSSAM